MRAQPKPRSTGTDVAWVRKGTVGKGLAGALLSSGGGLLKALGIAAWGVAQRPRIAAGIVLSVVAWNFVGEGWMIGTLIVLAVGSAVFAVKRPQDLRAWWRRGVYQRRWRGAMVACRLAVEGRIPQRRRLIQASWGERVLISLPMGVGPEDVQAQSARLASAFKSVQCRVREDKPGRLWLEFSDGRALRESIPCPAFPERTDLTAVRLGNREDGSPWTIEVQHPEHGYRHLFVAGTTGAGKSGLFWQAFREFGQAIQEGWLELRVADPKQGAEFGRGQALFAQYADMEEDIAKMLRGAVETMREYGTFMKSQGQAQHVPTVARPVIGVIVDEVVSLLKDCEDKKLAAQMERDMRILARQGRVMGVFIWAATQDPREEAFPLRSYFPTALGLRMRAANHPDMVFGRGARDAGATCDKIRMDMPGTGFEIQDDGVMLVRAFYVSPQDRAELLERFGRHTWRVADDLDQQALDEEFNVDDEADVDA